MADPRHFFERYLRLSLDALGREGAREQLSEEAVPNALTEASKYGVLVELWFGHSHQSGFFHLELDQRSLTTPSSSGELFAPIPLDHPMSTLPTLSSQTAMGKSASASSAASAAAVSSSLSATAASGLLASEIWTKFRLSATLVRKSDGKMLLLGEDLMAVSTRPRRQIVFQTGTSPVSTDFDRVLQVLSGDPFLALFLQTRDGSCFRHILAFRGPLDEDGRLKHISSLRLRMQGLGRVGDEPSAAAILAIWRHLAAWG